MQSRPPSPVRRQTSDGAARSTSHPAAGDGSRGAGRAASSKPAAGTSVGAETRWRAGARGEPREAPSARSAAAPGRSTRGTTFARGWWPATAPASGSRPVRIARLVSVRSMVLGVVLLAAFTLLFPTVRAYLGQRAELDALAGQVAEAEQEEEVLSHELDRWQDAAYVTAQARERLGYVMPGETAYRVIDPEVVSEPETGVGTDPTRVPISSVGATDEPWYATVWESAQVAGEAELPQDGQE